MTVHAGPVPLCCPVCHADLTAQGPEQIDCTRCARRWPVVCGIPDLRVLPDPYIAMDADRAKARTVAAQLQALDFAGLVAFYYSITDVVPPDDARRYTAGLRAAAVRAAATLEDWERTAAFSPGPTTRVLDLGCGTAPLALALAARGTPVVGVDIALRWLIVAQSRLREAGREVPLVCASAEHLPFRDGAFDLVMGESVLEVVHDQDATLAHAHRVLAPGGRLWLTTPNRRSLGPDPHIGAPAGGWWPRPWLDAWARRRGAIPPRRRLLTPGDLRRLCASHGFAPPHIFLPSLAPSQVAALPTPLRAAATVYGLLQRLPPAVPILTTFGPLFGAVTVREAA